MGNITTFTSESVCAGHPDKICDQVSDAILDAVLAQDPNGRVAIEALVGFDRVVLAGEMTTAAEVDLEKVARRQIKKLGYIYAEDNFTYLSPINIFVHAQSPEIAAGVKKKGAGDQGMMFGFAIRETQNFMPLPITLAHAITKRIDEVREKKVLPYLKPDGKSQVTVVYENGVPKDIGQVVVAVPHLKTVPIETVKNDVLRHVGNYVLGKYGFGISKDKLVVNGTGVWHKGGPASDTGLTGRKIIVDTYGGYARVGGGAFSGKDPTKVDRSGAYAARFIAKNIVANGLAEKAEVRLAYFIGAKKPTMQEVETFGTEKASQKAVNEYARKILDTSVEGIIEGLNLLQPIYTKTAAYGHFGRDGFPWEKVIFSSQEG